MDTYYNEETARNPIWSKYGFQFEVNRCFQDRLQHQSGNSWESWFLQNGEIFKIVSSNVTEDYLAIKFGTQILKVTQMPSFFSAFWLEFPWSWSFREDNISCQYTSVTNLACFGMLLGEKLEEKWTKGHVQKKGGEWEGKKEEMMKNKTRQMRTGTNSRRETFDLWWLKLQPCVYARKSVPRNDSKRNLQKSSEVKREGWSSVLFLINDQWPKRTGGLEALWAVIRRINPRNLSSDLRSKPWTCHYRWSMKIHTSGMDLHQVIIYCTPLSSDKKMINDDFNLLLQ